MKGTASKSRHSWGAGNKLLNTNRSMTLVNRENCYEKVVTLGLRRSGWQKPWSIRYPHTTKISQTFMFYLSTRLSSFEIYFSAKMSTCLSCCQVELRVWKNRKTPYFLENKRNLCVVSVTCGQRQTHLKYTSKHLFVNSFVTIFLFVVIIIMHHGY